MQYSPVLLVTFTTGFLFLRFFTGWHSASYTLSGYLQVIDFQVTFSTLICHLWVLVVQSSLWDCLVTAFGMLPTCHVPSMAKAVDLSASSFLSYGQWLILHMSSKSLPSSFFSFNPSSSWQLCLLVYAQPRACLDKHPESTPCMSMLSLVEHSSIFV